MTTLRHPVAFAAVVAALVGTSTSFAQETSPSSPRATEATPPPSTQAAPLGQPIAQPSSSTIGTPPPAAAQPPPTVVQQATSTTTTTAAPFSATPSDRITERTIEHRPNRALLGTGASLFVVSYGASAVGGAISERDEDKRLFIPVVGPWLDLGQRDCGPATPCGANEDLAKAMIVTSGIVQGAGVLMALSSFIVPESTTMQERTTTARATPPKIHVAPVSFAAGAGLGAVGRF